MQQEVFVLDGTLAENIALGCRFIDEERVGGDSEAGEIGCLVDELPQEWILLWVKGEEGFREVRNNG